MLRWLLQCVSSHITREDASELESGRCRTALVTGSAAIWIGMQLVVGGGYRTPLKEASAAVAVITGAIVLSYLLWTKTAPGPLLEGTVYAWTFCVLSMAYITMVRGTPSSWQMVVVMLDVALVNQLPARATTAMLCAVGLALISYEVLRVTDVVILGAGNVEHLCDCTDPPCRLETDVMFMNLLSNLAILLIDFYLTRGFAWKVLEEKATMQRAIATAQSVAVCLGGFDLDIAEDLLTEEQIRLPAGLTEAMGKLLQNLRMYKPYLPKSCLPDEGEDIEVQDCALSEMSKSIAQASVTTDTTRGSVPVIHRTPVKEMSIRYCPLAVLNLYDVFEEVEADPCSVSAGFSDLLDSVVRQVEASRGIVDVFIGEKVFASFNASRMCFQHARGAARALQELLAGASGISSGVATGRVACGDLGCPDMRRFDVVGSLPLTASGLEQAARCMRASILCSVVTHADIEVFHQLRLVPRLVQVRRTQDSEPLNNSLSQMVFELVVDGDAGCKDDVVAPQEWMYELQESNNVWALYNDSVMAYLRGVDAAAVIAELKDIAQSDSATLARVLEDVGSREPLLIVI